MKTNRLAYITLLLSAFLMIACDEANDAPKPVGEEGTEQSTENSVLNGQGDKMYFPVAGSDKWETRSALDIGWDTTNLKDAIRYAQEKNSYNLLILHKGRIVVEEYWRETNASSQHDLQSVAKSMMAFVIGVLQEDGVVSIDDKVSDYLDTGWSLSPASEGDVTISHLLTMTSGLNEELKYVGRPGEVWRYSDGAFRKLYDVIQSATGTPFKDLFSAILFSKTGMNDYSWSGKDLLSPGRDLARFGLMILNRGTWSGEKLINDDGYFSDMVSSSQSLQEAYGYLWWVNGTDSWYDDDKKITVSGSIASSMPSDSWLAKGKHDQRIYIVPSLDLVVIRQGGNTMLPELGEGSFDVEFWKRLMRAIKKDT